MRYTTTLRSRGLNFICTCCSGPHRFSLQLVPGEITGYNGTYELMSLQYEVSQTDSVSFNSLVSVLLTTNDTESPQAYFRIAQVIILCYKKITRPTNLTTPYLKSKFTSRYARYLLGAIKLSNLKLPFMRPHIYNEIFPSQLLFAILQFSIKICSNVQSLQEKLILIKEYVLCSQTITLKVEQCRMF